LDSKTFFKKYFDVAVVIILAIVILAIVILAAVIMTNS